MPITITNVKAANEAQRLANDLALIALKAASRIPEGEEIALLLEAAGLRLVPQQRSVEGPFHFSGHPEKIELVTELSNELHELADAVRQLASVKTEDLGGLTSREVAERRRRVSTDLDERSDQLRKPLGPFTGLVPGARSRRSALEVDRLNLVREVLSRQPLPSQIFEQIAGSVLAAAGLTEAQLPTLAVLTKEAEQLHRDLLERGETIVAWVSDAISEDVGGIELDLADTNASRTRLRKRKAVATQRRDVVIAQKLAEKVDRARQEAVASRARSARLEEDRNAKAARSREANLRAFKARRKMEKAGLNSGAAPMHDSSPEFGF